MGVQRRLLQLLEGTYLNESWFTKKQEKVETKTEITPDQAIKEFKEIKKKILDAINGYKYKNLIKVSDQFKSINTAKDIETEWSKYKDFVITVYEAERDEFKVVDRQEGHKQIYGNEDHDDSWEYWDVFFKMVHAAVKDSEYFNFDDETYKREYRSYIALKHKYTIKVD